MERSKATKKIQHSEKSSIYYAVKSKNDIYYQMASIFSAAKKDDTLLKEVFRGVLDRQLSEKISGKISINSL